MKFEETRKSSTPIAASVKRRRIRARVYASNIIDKLSKLSEILGLRPIYVSEEIKYFVPSSRVSLWTIEANGRHAPSDGVASTSAAT